MPTEVDLKVGVNLTVGSLPVSLVAEIDKTSERTVYTFNGSIQDAEIPLSQFMQYVAQQFGVTVALPPELDLAARIDYLAGQIIQTNPTTGAKKTELGIAGKFDLSVAAKTFTLEFYAGALLASPTPEAGNPYVVGASIETSLAFKDLPVVGKIGGFNELALTQIGFSYTNSKKPQEFSIPQVKSSPNPLYTRDDPNAKNAKVYSIAPSAAGQSYKLTSGGFSLTAGLTKSGEVANNFALPMALPATAPPAAPAPYYPKPTSPPATSVHWIDINKTFGPVNLQKIGLNYQRGRATFGLTADFTLGGFTLGLEGLTITFPLPLPSIPAGAGVDFDLAGLSFAIVRGGFTLSGAFLKVLKNDVLNYYGQVVCQVGSFGLQALGGYTPEYVDQNDKHHDASFFLYAAIKVPLGGPPFLFVTGFAGGFGLNRTLILPTIENLSGYILLPYNAPKQAATASETISSVLPQLEKWFIERTGQYWVAAGIMFTSFQMIDAFALLTVGFGVDFQIALLGSCSMSFPPKVSVPVAYVEVDLIASYTPVNGLLAVAGKLSPASYIYGGFCRLTGGFAFYTWFGGDFKGDFVVSLGGYSPYFVKPDHYPNVPRLGISLGLGPFQVTGGAYFALTPGSMMAGIAMLATWTSGPVKAWFGVGVDFLLAWAPFHYEARAYAVIGCSIDLGLFTLNLEIGAGLFVWGPPFGGRAYVDLDIFTFTIEFGAPAAPTPPVGWADFKKFLPQNTGTAPVTIESARMTRRPRQGRRRRAVALRPAARASGETNILGASVTKGLQQTSQAGLDWIIDPDNFAILTNSTIPANNGEWKLSTGVFAFPIEVSAYNPPNVTPNAPYLSLPADAPRFSPAEVWNPTLDIGPMDKKHVESFHTIEFKIAGGALISTLSAQPIVLDVNAAMWGPSIAQKTANDERIIPKALTGFLITPIPRKPASVDGLPLIELLFAANYKTGFTYTAPAVDSRYTVTSDPGKDTLKIFVRGDHTEDFVNTGYILSSLINPWIGSQREGILADLHKNGFPTFTPSEIDLTVFARDTALADWPGVQKLGDSTLG
ncbi:MAG: hypothetical protein JO340_19690 [Acidobacteriaceae bacterium]|nr:hypothetical protein [Acidobacteriaceae bacterium]